MPGTSAGGARLADNADQIVPTVAAPLLSGDQSRRLLVTCRHRARFSFFKNAFVIGLSWRKP
jgi:hypothetical protein